MIKEKRKEKGLTQSKLAEKLGISKGYLSKLEKHPFICNPNVNLIIKLLKELEIHPIKIFIFFTKNKFCTYKN
ncbi:MAG: helix-turn-helix transcriptional regulator [Clostridium sp.]|uniref:helix-turn-helix domain-containing protein n=1 Tax=Clostridium sp. TaxID=1506 RepID=UPI0025C5DE5E|nr:helix-turn-helix transcriptional regulator [Clostridium sp.]MCE5222036.1 helix-turn-helix transcriptional regulator [Clostridium sp.]